MKFADNFAPCSFHSSFQGTQITVEDLFYNVTTRRKVRPTVHCGPLKRCQFAFKLKVLIIHALNIQVYKTLPNTNSKSSTNESAAGG